MARPRPPAKDDDPDNKKRKRKEPIGPIPENPEDAPIGSVAREVAKMRQREKIEKDFNKQKREEKKQEREKEKKQKKADFMKAIADEVREDMKRTERARGEDWVNWRVVNEDEIEDEDWEEESEGEKEEEEEPHDDTKMHTASESVSDQRRPASASPLPGSNVMDSDSPLGGSQTKESPWYDVDDFPASAQEQFRQALKDEASTNLTLRRIVPIVGELSWQNFDVRGQLKTQGWVHVPGVTVTAPQDPISADSDWMLISDCAQGLRNLFRENTVRTGIHHEVQLRVRRAAQQHALPMTMWDLRGLVPVYTGDDEYEKKFKIGKWDPSRRRA